MHVSLPFLIEAQAGPARLGRISTAHGEVETPAFMPVGTAGTVKAVPQDVLEELGAQIILGNTYHLYLRPGHELVRKLGGLHRFMSWNRALLTDSGGFQVFSLSELRKVTEDGVSFRSHLDGTSHLFTPERSMEIQIALGADIVMAFDECTEHPAERERARQSMEMTLRWARRSKEYFESHKDECPWEESGHRDIGSSGHPETQNHNHLAAQPGAALPHGAQNRHAPGTPAAVHELSSPELPTTPALFGIVQGGMYGDLRRESAERTVELDFPGYAIGGLSVGESREKTMEMIANALEVLPKDKPRYVMGVGYPEEIVQYAAMGVDMMDCVLPTRAARHGLLFTSEGRMNIKNARYAQDQQPPDSKCGCRVCSRYTRAYLRHLFVSAEPLAGVLNTVHNLAFYLDTMRAVRHAIKLGDLSGMPSRSVSLA
ncbi:MAG TPA: tRNA guanosine(34) transglycosylase Tgt [Candidatus Angelobacter sp.]|nr:tRNA guanosine(34) transglycosylase Tgt [Candidatus Angelobacter sp.]